MMAQKKTPKGYISLLKAVELVSKKGPFTTKDDPAEAAREWLFEQFRFGCLVPVVGYWKIRSGYWTLLGRQSMDSGLFEPGCQRRSKMGPLGGVKLVHFL
jgi:hypothetical protein